MKRIILIVHLFLLSGSHSYSQTGKPYRFNSDVLNAIFSNRNFVRHFPRDFKDTVVFVDTFKVFNCSKPAFFKEQAVIFTDKFVKSISYGPQSSKYLSRAHEPKLYVVLMDFSEERKRYKLLIWIPRSNGVFYAYIYKRKKIKVKVYDGGYF